MMNHHSTPAGLRGISDRDIITYVNSDQLQGSVNLVPAEYTRKLVRHFIHDITISYIHVFITTVV